MVTLYQSENLRSEAEKIFGTEKLRLKKLIPNADIQHVGGTAVPGLLTKGDVDIQVRVNRSQFEAAKQTLRRTYRGNQLRNWSPTFASFKDVRSHKLHVGIQLTVIDSEDDIFTKHRDVLIKSNKARADYNKLKQRGSRKSMAAYRKAKEKFFNT